MVKTPDCCRGTGSILDQGTKILHAVHRGQKISSVAQSCPTLCDRMDCSTPGFPVHHQIPELTQTHVHLVSDAIQLSHSLSSPSPPVFSLSQHQDFSSISPSNEYSGLISFSMDWFDLLAVRGTRQSLHHHSSKASILQRSAFFIVQFFFF